MIKTIDYLFLYSLGAIWLLLLFNVRCSFAGYSFYLETMARKIDIIKGIPYYPCVSILVPAHNEEKVIERSMLAMLKLDYPRDKLEIIVINDNSKDQTGNILQNLQLQYPDRNLKIITTDDQTGGKGKANALNMGLKQAQGEYIVVYDADNTPEVMSLRYLVYEILSCERYGAVIGKFRTRNKNASMLTKFINIETLSFQWMIQGGRWKLHRLCLLPGTNFIIQKKLLEEIGGWDPKAIAEDTELSIRVYFQGYEIAFMPKAVAWEQEPETLSVWLKQRTRWVKGNIYVLNKFLLSSLHASGPIILDLVYRLVETFLFFSAIIISDVIFVLGLLGIDKISLPGNFIIIWVLAYILFILEISINLTMEKGELNFHNTLLVMLMYFTYCQCWIVVCVRGIYSYTRDAVLKREHVWYKTERF
ncbi:MAG: glycosyltransferase family 2 protein [Firmicutes bacterium]|jgi:cellulose synthase/poly-beta-1,6-N-acetylglucosamine synthase-like glycosyltransferase|nr:glycosyltransferase family 2 protein [Bacillota bacterium]